jgi:L-ribulose-5-phosphate 4-epimerase
MLLKELREEVLEANLELVRSGLVLFTFGNASGVDRSEGLIVIKPSGVPYATMRAEDMVVTDMNGKVVDGKLRPSSDMDTHSLLYREFPELGGVVHTHSEYATSFAQAGLAIPALGTTHADYFHGPVPVTEPLTDEAIQGDYEHETGLAILRAVQPEGAAHFNPFAVPACLAHGHAPFTWGRTPGDAARTAVLLEAVAKLAHHTLSLRASALGVSQALLDCHHLRKHGPNATYGQAKAV